MSEQLRHEEKRKRVTLKDLAPQISLRDWPSIEELCREASITPAELTESVARRSDIIFSNIEDYDTISPHLDFIFRLYHALNKNENLPEELQLLSQKMSSYEAFMEAFHGLGKLDHNSYDDWRSAVTRVYKEAHPENVLRVQEKASGKSGISAKVIKTPIIREKEQIEQEEWELVTTLRDVAKFYATQAVLDSYNTAKLNGEQFTLGFNHATTSASLEGIAKQQALVSRSTLEDLGEPVVSGEARDYSPRIYAVGGYLAGGHYSHLRWFNEFPITIEFSSDTKREEHAPDHGISLGHRVPLSNIKRIFCPFENRLAVQTWVRANAPHVDVQFIEVYNLCELEEEVSNR